MKYQIMLYSGMIGSLIMLVITIILFIKCSVIEVIKDLTGIKINRRSNIKNKDIESIVNSTGRVDRRFNSTTTGIIEKQKSAKGPRVKRAKNDDTTYIEEETNILEEETSLLEEETSILEEETSLLEEETSILEEETCLLDEETTLLEEETTLLNEEETTILEEQILGDGQYIYEINIAVINCDSIINI